MTITLSPATLEWRRFRDLVFAFTAQNVHNRYRGSVLGIFWSLLNPLLATAVYVTVFSFSFRNYYGSTVAYGEAVFIGLVVNTFFSQASSQALGTIVNSGGLLQKARIPFEAFPTAMVASHTVQLTLASVPILVTLTAIVSRDIAHVILLLVPLSGLVMLALGFGFLTSALYVYFRDMPYIYDVFVFLMWITSPVFYPIGIVPVKVRTFLVWNPLYSTMTSLRELALTAGPIPWALMGVSLASGATALVFGWLIFRALERDFMDLI